MEPLRFEKKGFWRFGWMGLLVLGWTLLSMGCESSSPDGLCHPARLDDPQAYISGIENERNARNEAYRDPKQTPVAKEDLPHWKGLQFYPVDPHAVLEGPLVRKMNPKRLEIPDTGGENRHAEEIGYFLIDLGAGPEKLPVYRMLDGDDLFLPFLDATTEIETYPAGRYLDLVSLGHDRYRLDFNQAYNPYCAYGGAWSCPITPQSNRLEAAVRFGERGYKFLEEENSAPAGTHSHDGAARDKASSHSD